MDTVMSLPEKTSLAILVVLRAEAKKLADLHGWVIIKLGALVHLCRGGMLSMALRLPRVDTTLKLSLQSHDTCR